MKSLSEFSRLIKKDIDLRFFFILKKIKIQTKHQSRQLGYINNSKFNLGIP
jgi:hypothetical protein